VQCGRHQRQGLTCGIHVVVVVIVVGPCGRGGGGGGGGGDVVVVTVVVVNPLPWPVPLPLPLGVDCTIGVVTPLPVPPPGVTCAFCAAAIPNRAAKAITALVISKWSTGFSCDGNSGKMFHGCMSVCGWVGGWEGWGSEG
jgi:hypothetical protein